MGIRNYFWKERVAKMNKTVTEIIEEIKGTDACTDLSDDESTYVIIRNGECASVARNRARGNKDCLLGSLEYTLDEVSSYQEHSDLVYILNLETKEEFLLSKAQLVTLIEVLKDEKKRDSVLRKITELEDQIAELKKEVLK